MTEDNCPGDPVQKEPTAFARLLAATALIIITGAMIYMVAYYVINYLIPAVAAGASYFSQMGYHGG